MYALPHATLLDADVSWPWHSPNPSSKAPGYPLDGVQTVLKKLWLAPNTVSVCFGGGSPATRYRESSKKWMPCRSKTSPSQYGSITASGTSLMVARVKSTGASGSTASIP